MREFEASRRAKEIRQNEMDGEPNGRDLLKNRENTNLYKKENQSAKNFIYIRALNNTFIRNNASGLDDKLKIYIGEKEPC